MLAMFCLAMRRDVYARVGPLDERFEVGLLEDDDYALRVRREGLRMICAEDVLVHHFGEASFGALVPTGKRDRLLEANRRRFEEKWDIPWVPYERRESPEYEQVAVLTRRAVLGVVPPGATVLVVSRGDERLLELDGRTGWHYPRAADGVYAGYYPGSSEEAVDHLEELRRRGAAFLVIPRTGLWWLEHYAGLREHLERRYRNVAAGRGECVIYALAGEPS
jgi:hypothetical protein